MVPKVVQDAGYTAVGLGVMAVQEVQTRRRDLRTAVGHQVRCVTAQAGSMAERARHLGAPLVAQLGRATRRLGSR